MFLPFMIHRLGPHRFHWLRGAWENSEGILCPPSRGGRGECQPTFLYGSTNSSTWFGETDEGLLHRAVRCYPSSV